ncbi:MAG: hypothetical protein QNJ04_04920, partial [Desulfobacterales bacterium]|nr:hypothetical protein [Desulfobacterales bacterium]
MAEEHRIEIQTAAEPPTEDDADAVENASAGEAVHSSDNKSEDETDEALPNEAETQAPDLDLQNELEKVRG